MSKISSTWFDMFPEYHTNAKLHIEKIKSRSNTDIFAPIKINENDILEVNRISQTELEYSGEIKLKDILTRLQYLAHYNEDETEIKPRCTIRMNILGEKITFKLDEFMMSNDNRGWQIMVYDDADVRPTFDSVMKKLNRIDPCKLARSILKALYTPLNKQTKFELNDCVDLNAVRMFILLTHIAEAAVPTPTALEEYSEHITGNKVVSHDKRNTYLNKKHGRTPMMDKIVRAKLRKCAYLPIFSNEFSAEEFPSQSQKGTGKSRERALKGYEIDHLSDFEDDLSQQMGEISI